MKIHGGIIVTKREHREVTDDTIYY